MSQFLWESLKINGKVAVELVENVGDQCAAYALKPGVYACASYVP